MKRIQSFSNCFISVIMILDTTTTKSLFLDMVFEYDMNEKEIIVVKTSTKRNKKRIKTMSDYENK